MKQLFILPILACVFTTWIYAQDNQPVTASDLKTWCFYLANDEMKGRKNGSPEMKKAADFIAESFGKAGLKPLSAEAGYFQEYVTNRNKIDITERNVIGMIEGSDPVLKKEWIILSAHFDHIGIGKPIDGDSIFNGADDNATGTITVMALAKTLQSSITRPKRSILFVAYSGEEIGMQGSKWFKGHAPMPLDQIKLNLNFEMEGESATLGKNIYLLTGHQFTDFGDLLDEYNKKTNWVRAKKFKSPPWVFMASDNATFAINRAGEKPVLSIPAFSIVTTDDMNFIHKVTDEPDRMDYENMASLVSYLTNLVLFLSADPLDIHWNQEAFDNFNKH
jgi:hypothetical protein